MKGNEETLIKANQERPERREKQNFFQLRKGTKLASETS
jgi:hypothetical protein